MRKLLLVLAAVAFAAPVRAADPGPTVELRVKAVKDLLPLAGYFGDLIGQEEQAEQGAKFVEAMAGKKGVIEGIDITKPIGLSATLTPNMVDSPIVGFLPVGDEKAFLNLLRGKLNLDPKKGDDGLYSLTLPNVPPTVYFRFHKGYACVTVHNKATLDAADLPDPAAFFAKEQAAVLAVTTHLDRIPADVRKTFLGQFELKMADAKAAPAKTAAEKQGRDFAIDLGLDVINTLLTDGGAAGLTLTVDPKADDIGLNFTLTAKDGSDLKATFAAAAKRTAVAPLAATKDAVLSAAVNFRVPEAYQKRYSDAVDLLMADALENAKGNDRDALKKFFDAIEPTLKAGVFQLGTSLTATSGGRFEFLSAVRMTGGKKLEELAKEFAPFIPEEKVKLKFDVDKAGPAAVHEIVPPSDEKAEKLFGKGSVWLTTADDLFVVGYGADAAAAKKLAKAAAAASPIFAVEASVTRFLPIVDDKLSAEQIAGVAKEAFGDAKPAGRDTIKFAVTGGDKLTTTVSVKGKALKFLALTDKKKKEQ